MDRMDDLEGRLDACCSQKAELPPPPPAPKPQPKPKQVLSVCGEGTQEYADNGDKDFVLPEGQHYCHCKAPDEGESETILVLSPGYKQKCVPKHAVDKAYVDARAKGKVSVKSYLRFRTELKGKMVVVKENILKTDFHLAKLEDDVADLKDEVADQGRKRADQGRQIDEIARHWLTLMIGVGGTLIYRDATFAGDGHAVGILTMNLSDVAGIIAEGQFGPIGGGTFNGVGTRGGAGAGVVFNLDGAMAQVRLAIELAFLQDNRLENDVNGATGNGMGYLVGPKARLMWSPVDWFTFSPFVGVGWGVVGHERSDGTALTRVGTQVYGGLDILFGGGVIRKVDESEPAKPAPRSPNVLEDVGDKGVDDIDHLDQFRDQVEVEATSTAETKSSSKVRPVPPPPTDGPPVVLFEHKE